MSTWRACGGATGAGAGAGTAGSCGGACGIGGGWYDAIGGFHQVEQRARGVAARPSPRAAARAAAPPAPSMPIDFSNLVRLPPELELVEVLLVEQPQHVARDGAAGRRRPTA